MPLQTFEARLQDGVQYLQDGLPRVARQLLDPLLEARPYHPVLRFDLAVTYRLLGWIELGLGHARVAMELLETAPAAALYGLLLHLARRRAEARTQFGRALDLDPDYRPASLYLAALDREEGRIGEAIAGLTRALEGGPWALPRLADERACGQLFDLQQDPPRPADPSICAVMALGELLLPDGRLAWVEPSASVPRLRAPPRSARETTPEELALALHEARAVVALTGAGISAGSGLATRKELWTRHDREASVSAIGCAHEPRALWDAMRDLLSGPRARPNAAHEVLARLPRVQAILTQNVDGLHQQAALSGEGPPILELHGSLWRLVCPRCGTLQDCDPWRLVCVHVVPPRCLTCADPLRPDVVLFGEQVPRAILAAALAAVESCELLLVVGCAMDVSPASELPRIAAARGARIVEIKTERSRLSAAVGAELLLGPAEERLPRVLRALAALEPVEPLPTLRPIHSEPEPEPWVPVRIDLGDFQPTVDRFGVYRWYRAPGETVRGGESLVEIETDKATLELEAPLSGVLRRVEVPEGAEVSQGGVLGWIEPAGSFEPAPSPKLPPVKALPSTFREPQIELFARLGPRPDRIYEALLARMSAARWLAPDPGLDPQTLADAHARRLGLPPLQVWVSEDPVEVADRWIGAWPRAAREPDARTLAWREAWAAATLRARARHEARYPVKEGGQVELTRGILQRMDALHGPEERGRRQGTSERITAALQLEPLVRLWLLALGTGEGEENPWEPLLDLWEGGAWPFALPDGVLGVYLLRGAPPAEAREREPTLGLERWFPGLHGIPRVGIPP